MKQSQLTVTDVRLNEYPHRLPSTSKTVLDKAVIIVQTVILKTCAVGRTSGICCTHGREAPAYVLLLWSTAVSICLLAGCGEPEPELLPAAPSGADARAAEVFESAPAQQPTPAQSLARTTPAQPLPTPQDAAPLATGYPSQGSGQRPTGASNSQANAAEQQPEAVSRPDDVANWSFDDLATARVDGDEKLLDAVNHLLEQRGDEDEVIQALLSLLEIDPPEKPADEDHGANPTNNPHPIAAAERIGAPRGNSPHRFGPAAQQSPATPVKHRFVSADIAARIIEGLGGSGSAVATDGLKKLIVGKQPAPLHEQDVLALAIRALAASISPEKEALLLGLLMDPGNAQPAKFVETSVAAQGPGRPGIRNFRGGGPIGPTRVVTPIHGGPGRPYGRGNPQAGGELNLEWIQDEVIAAAGHQFSKDSRNKLARFLNSSDVVIETAQLVEQLLIQDDPRNDPAQILLVTNSYTEQPTRDQIEEILIQSSSKSLLDMLAISESNLNSQSGAHGRLGGSRPFQATNTRPPTQHQRRPSRRSSQPTNHSPLSPQQPPTEAAIESIDPDERRRQQLKIIWRSKVVEMLYGALQQKEFESVDSRIPLLMGTIPIAPARKSLSKVLSSYQGKDPDTLFKMGLFSSTTLDPAALIFGKQVYHQNKRNATESDGKQSADAWSKQLEPFVADLCERFHAASSATDADEGKKATRKRFPVRLHGGGKTMARYDLVWPTDLDKTWKRYRVAPLELHYIRLEEESLAKQTVFYYRHHNEDARERKINNGVWFDSFDRKSQMSVDVRITTPEGDLGIPVGAENNKPGQRNTSRGGRERKTIIVEVLTVAIPQEKATS